LGADKLIIELAKSGKVYGGGSAGAVVAGPTLRHFETADDPHDAPEVIWEGLGLTDSVVVPHMDNVKFQEVIHGIRDRLIADGNKVVPLTDAQALVINGDTQKVI
jgi:peptidase E